jgi:hypothetical protein
MSFGIIQVKRLTPSALATSGAKGRRETRTGVREIHRTALTFFSLFYPLILASLIEIWYCQKLSFPLPLGERVRVRGNRQYQQTFF